MSGRVIVVGSVNVNLVARVPHLPRPGETVTGGSYERHQGGKGGNQAVAAARLRRPTLFIGALGDDAFEIEARRALWSERVDVSMVASLPDQPTGVALILVDASGENEIAVVPGANGAIESGYVRDCLARLGPLGGDVLLVCNEVPLHVVREALVCGQAARATTILNPAPAIGIDRSIFGLADIVTPNRSELATLLGADARPTRRQTDTANSDMAMQVRTLLDPRPEGPGVRKAVIVTLGAAGAMVVERVGSGLAGSAVRSERAEAAAATAIGSAPPTWPDRREVNGPREGRPEQIGTAPATPSITQAAADGAPENAVRVGDYHVWEVASDGVATLDSTGAGDAFCGALAVSVAEGRSLAVAVRRAVAAGALATTHVGAREGMPTAAELEEFLTARRSG